MADEGNHQTDDGDCANVILMSLTSFSFLWKILISCVQLVQALSESRPMLHLTTGVYHTMMSLMLLSSQLEVLAPSPLDVTRTLVTIGVTLLMYHLLFGNQHWRRRRRLTTMELDVAKEQLTFLEDKLQRPGPEDDYYDDDGAGDDGSSVSGRRRKNGNKNKKPREIRIFMADGAFNMMHFGHMNASDWQDR
jgi:hypothetical protein